MEAKRSLKNMSVCKYRNIISYTEYYCKMKERIITINECRGCPRHPDINPLFENIVSETNRRLNNDR